MSTHASAQSLQVDLSTEKTVTHSEGEVEDWTVELIEAGLWTNTGGRIKRLAHYVSDETFLLAYGDGVFDVDLKEMLSSTAATASC